jgi:glycosyltransferase involved in cell wall biosynthesis
VRFLGTADDDELGWLLSNCAAVVQAGEEDLGLVPLEACVMGTPVVAFARGGAQETVLDGRTGILFASQEPDVLAKAMVEAGERTWDAEAMCRHAEAFSEVRFHARVREELQRIGAAVTPAPVPAASAPRAMAPVVERESGWVEDALAVEGAS